MIHEHVRVGIHRWNEQVVTRGQRQFVVMVGTTSVVHPALEDRHAEAGFAEPESHRTAAGSAANYHYVRMFGGHRHSVGTPVAAGCGIYRMKRHPTAPRLPPWSGSHRNPATVMLTIVTKKR